MVSHRSSAASSFVVDELEEISMEPEPVAGITQDLRMSQPSMPTGAKESSSASEDEATLSVVGSALQRTSEGIPGQAPASSLAQQLPTTREKHETAMVSHNSSAASSFVVDELEEISMEPEPGAGMTQDLRMSQPSMPTGAKESSSASEDEATLSVVGSTLQRTSDNIPGHAPASSLAQQLPTTREMHETAMVSHRSSAASSFVVDELEEISMEPEPVAGITQDLRMSQPSMPTGAKESSSASEDEATLSVVGSALQRTSDGIPGQAPASSLAQQLPTTREKHETAMVSHNSSAASSFVVDELEEISMEPEPGAGMTQDLRMSQPSMPTGAKESSSASEDEAALSVAGSALRRTSEGIPGQAPASSLAQQLPMTREKHETAMVSHNSSAASSFVVDELEEISIGQEPVAGMTQDLRMSQPSMPTGAKESSSASEDEATLSVVGSALQKTSDGIPGQAPASSLAQQLPTTREKYETAMVSHNSSAASSFVVDELEEISMEPEPGAGMTQDLRMSQPSMPTGAKESSSASEGEATLSAVGSTLQRKSDDIPDQAGVLGSSS